MKSEYFFEQCEELGLTSNSAIAGSFMVSSQTIRNWRKLDEVPCWVDFALHAVREGSTSTNFDFSDFKKWQRDNGVSTYEQTGNIFGIKRQAVHQWFRRGRFPRWLSIACRGYNISH